MKKKLKYTSISFKVKILNFNIFIKKIISKLIILRYRISYKMQILRKLS